MGVTIKEAQLVEELKGNEKLPVSDGSNIPKSVSIEQIKEFANKDIDIPTKVSELENDSEFTTKKELEDAVNAIPIPDVSGQISAALVDYVKKVEGKGLSTNDFTNELKKKLEDITPYDPSELESEIDKLGTALNTLVEGNASNAIESFNEIIDFLKNVSDTESLSGIIAGINTRIAEVEAKIPTKASELENDKNYLTEHQDISHLATKQELQGKQDVISDLEDIREGASLGKTALQSVPEEYVTMDELDRLLSESPFEFVDLGLPSGTLWATCNIGAANPEEAGLYFAWGEIEGYKVSYTADGNVITSTTITDKDGNATDKEFSAEYYKWCDGSLDNLTKYNYDKNKGVVDNLNQLVLVDDAVYAVDRHSRMPSVADFEELIANTTFSKLVIGNQGCGKFTAANGKSIILPVVGRVNAQGITGVNAWAVYPTREVSGTDPSDCKVMYFTSSYSPRIDTGARFVGLPVRAVKNKLYGNDDYYYTKEETNVKLEEKQDIISDIETIRSGAAKGATAIQEYQSLEGYAKDSELAAVAKSGSYNDLSNKPTIPSAVTESTVSGWGFTKNQGTYVKPSSGIPLSDLEDSAQESIGKGAEAYGYVLQLNTAINGKQDKIADLDAIRSGAAKGSTALQPQNGGSGNKFLADDNTYKEINIPSGDFATKTELDEKQDKVIVVDHGTDDTTFVLTPNKLHRWGEMGSLTLTLAAPTDGTIVNHYMVEFVSGATATTLTMPDTIVWQSELAIEAGKTYQISIVDNLGVIGGW